MIPLENWRWEEQYKDSKAFRNEPKDSTRRAWQATDKLLTKCPKRVETFLSSLGYDIIPETRERTRNQLWRDCRKADVEIQAKEFRMKVNHGLRDLGLQCVTPGIAKELSWRMLELHMPYLAVDKEEADKLMGQVVPEEEPDVDVSGMEFLPEWLRWVFLHPGLPFTEEEVAGSTEMLQRVNAFEEKYPCPNQGSRNMLIATRGNQKEMSLLFKDCLRQYVEERKRTQTKEATEDDAETQAIADLEVLFASDD